MRSKMLKTSIEIEFPFNKPDLNGVMYTKEAVENAVNNFSKVPIIFSSNDGESKIIGSTIGDSYAVTVDEENGVCKFTVDGVIYSGGTECINVEFNLEDKIDSFEICSIGFSEG